MVGGLRKPNLQKFANTCVKSKAPLSPSGPTVYIPTPSQQEIQCRKTWAQILAKKLAEILLKFTIYHMCNFSLIKWHILPPMINGLNDLNLIAPLT